MRKWVVDKNNFKGYAESILTENGCSPYSGKTAEEYIAEGFDILDYKEYSTLVKEWNDSLCGNWKEITADDFNDALCVLPPEDMHDGGFYMGERYTEDVSAFYQKLSGKYYTSFQHIGTPRKEIIKQLLQFVSNEKGISNDGN